MPDKDVPPLRLEWRDPAELAENPSDISVTERWLPVVGYENYYEVSNFGVVRSIFRRVAVGHGATRGVKSRVSVLGRHAQGYRVVSLSRGGTVSVRLVHRVVVEAFLGPIAANAEVNHKDGDKANNRVANLEIVSRQENIDHAVRLGLISNKGENNSQAKITAQTALAILSDRSKGMGYKSLARKHGVSWSIARGVSSGKTWSHLQSRCVLST